MSRVVWKYPLVPDGPDWSTTVIVPGPDFAKALCVGGQDGGLLVWVEVTPGLGVGPLRLLVRGTGHDFTGQERRYVGTAFVGPFVWHVYEAAP